MQKQDYPMWLYRGHQSRVVKDQHEHNVLMKSGGWSESPAPAEVPKKEEPAAEAELEATEEPDSAEVGRKDKKEKKK